MLGIQLVSVSEFDLESFSCTAVHRPGKRSPVREANRVLLTEGQRRVITLSVCCFSYAV